MFLRFVKVIRIYQIAKSEFENFDFHEVAA